jgi:hypothetical protein
MCPSCGLPLTPAFEYEVDGLLFWEVICVKCDLGVAEWIGLDDGVVRAVDNPPFPAGPRPL